MEIPLDFNLERDRISLVCMIKIPPKDLPLPVKFLVDTGSPETFIDAIDAARYRIYTKNLTLSKHLLMGGTKIALYKLGKVTMILRNDVDGLETIEFNDLKVAESAWTRPGAVSSGTSIIGMNFLLENKLRLFVDPTNEVAHISSE